MINNYLKDMTILYVEDDKTLLSVYSEQLKDKVKKLYLAENGQEGYEKFLEHQPDIIIADIMMPVLNGVAMTRKIRDKDSSIPIVITTSSDDQGYLTDTLGLGVQGYLAKPVNFDELLDLLSTISKLIQIEKEKTSQKKALQEQYNIDMLHI